jgi:hypothetical protein
MEVADVVVVVSMVVVADVDVVVSMVVVEELVVIDTELNLLMFNSI